MSKNYLLKIKLKIILNKILNFYKMRKKNYKNQLIKPLTKFYMEILFLIKI